MIGNTAVSNWQLERKSWTAYYQHQLSRQLAQAVVFISTARQPQQLRPHFDSFLVLLHQARARPELHSAYLELLTTVHPWPLRWGQWDAWELEIEQALPVLKAFNQPAKQAELMIYLAEIQFRTGRLETAVHTSRTALTLAWENQAIVTWAAAASREILTLNRLGRNETALNLLTHCEKQLSDAMSVIDEVEYLEAYGHLVLRRIIFMRRDGQAASAARLAQTLIDALSALPQANRRLLATLYTDQATMLWASDQYETAVTSLEQAIAIYTELGDTYEAITTRGNLGLVYWSMARLSEAEAAIRESLHLAETFNARWRMMNEIGNLCAISFSQGKLLDALQYTERHLELAQEANDSSEINRALGNRGLALLYLERFADALPDIKESIGQLQELGLQQQLAETYVHLSCCLYGLGQQEDAETAVAQAVQMAHKIDSPTLHSMVLRCQSLFVPAPEAVILMKQALENARLSRRRLDEAHCLLLLAVLNNGHQRTALWAEGAAIMQEIGAGTWLNGRSPDNPPIIGLII